MLQHSCAHPHTAYDHSRELSILTSHNDILVIAKDEHNERGEYVRVQENRMDKKLQEHLEKC